MGSIALAKRNLRIRMREILSGLPDQHVADQSARATAALLSLTEYRNANHIGIYLSALKREVYTELAVADALRSGKRVWIPFMYQNKETGDSQPRRVMDFVELESQEDVTQMVPDRWGIPTPPSDLIERRGFYLDKLYEQGNIELRDSQLDLVVVPGVAFDHACERLGHGKGFYDFFLERLHNFSIATKAHMPFLVGLALEEQLLPLGSSVPKSGRDWTLDAVITGDGAILRKR